MASNPSNLTTASSTAIDLSRLPPPAVVEALDFEAILDGWLADLIVLFPEFSATVESDPIVKLAQVGAYRELVLRKRVNDAARGVMIAYAVDTDLDNLAALFGVVRQEITPANQQTGEPAVMEDDDALRRRVLLAPDSFSVAGPASAYVFHALSANAGILDASAISLQPGNVTVSILAREGSGSAPPEMIEAVKAILNADDVRPLTDRVSVQSAQIVNFDIDAQLILYPGPDQALILATAEASLDDLLTRNRRLGRDITRSAITAALHVAGVQNVILAEPIADISIDATQAANLDARRIVFSGFDE